MTNREGLSQRGRVGIEPHLESRPLERDRERPGGQGKRDSVSDGADLRLLREWGREQDRARVST
jgi:hypothetical protein